MISSRATAAPRRVVAVVAGRGSGPAPGRALAYAVARSRSTSGSGRVVRRASALRAWWNRNVTGTRRGLGGGTGPGIGVTAWTLVASGTAGHGGGRTSMDVTVRAQVVTLM